MSSLPASAQVASSPSEDSQPGGRPACGSAAHRPKPGRKVYLDCINVLAIIGVVALHNRFNYRVDYDSPRLGSREHSFGYRGCRGAAFLHGLGHYPAEFHEP